jgi:hypothetical protein
VAHCQYAVAEGLPGPVCTVHGNPSPCPHDGKPALPFPIHVVACAEHRIEQIELARRAVAGTRPIMVHDGVEDDTTHLVELGDTDCWCDYVLIPSG